MRKNKRFILLVVAVLLANCLFAGLASAVETHKYDSDVYAYKTGAAEYFFGTDEMNPYGVLYGTYAIHVSLIKGALFGYGNGWIDVGFSSSETDNLFKVSSDNPSVVAVSTSVVGTTGWANEETGDFGEDGDFWLYASKEGSAKITLVAMDHHATWNGASASFTVTISRNGAWDIELVKKPTAANYKAGDKITVGLASAKTTPESLRVYPSSFAYDIEAFVYGKDIWSGGTADGEEIHGRVLKPVKDADGNVIAYEWVSGTTINWEYFYTGMMQYKFSDVVWSVSDASVAKYTANADGQSGTIEFLKSGSVTIKAALKSDSRVYDTITLTIDKGEIDETGKLVNADGKTSMTVKLTKGVAPATFTLKAQDAKTEIVKFKSSNKAVATIDEKTGVVTIVKDKEGTVQFTGYDKNGNSYTFNLKVKKVPVSKLTVTTKSIKVEAGKTAQIAWATKPAYAYNPDVKFTSSDKKVATVSATGLVTGVKAGKTTVVVTPKFAKDTVNPVTIKVTVK
jgi:hypothetical protein